MLRCEECRCVSETGKGWLGYIAEDPDDDDDEPVVAIYCPPCAARHLDAKPREPHYV